MGNADAQAQCKLGHLIWPPDTGGHTLAIHEGREPNNPASQTRCQSEDLQHLRLLVLQAQRPATP